MEEQRGCLKNQSESCSVKTGDTLETKQTNRTLPAMQALMRDTHVPVIMALNTRDEMSFLLNGHIDAWRKENTQC